MLQGAEPGEGEEGGGGGATTTPSPGGGDRKTQAGGSKRVASHSELTNGVAGHSDLTNSVLPPSEPRPVASRCPPSQLVNCTFSLLVATLVATFHEWLTTRPVRWEIRESVWTSCDLISVFINSKQSKCDISMCGMWQEMEKTIFLFGTAYQVDNRRRRRRRCSGKIGVYTQEKGGRREAWGETATVSGLELGQKYFRGTLVRFGFFRKSKYYKFLIYIGKTKIDFSRKYERNQSVGQHFRRDINKSHLFALTFFETSVKRTEWPIVSIVS